MVTKIGGKLTYTDRSKNSLGPKESEKYKQEVTTDRNIVITNYDSRNGDIDSQQTGSLKISIQNGQTNIYRKDSNGKVVGNLKSADWSSARYSVFNALCSLDGDAGTLSETDLRKAKTELKNDNIKDIRFDPVELVLSIIFKDDNVLRFDAESDAEMQAKKNN